MMLRHEKTNARRLSGISSPSSALNPLPKKIAGTLSTTIHNTSHMAVFTGNSSGIKATTPYPARTINRLPNSQALRLTRFARKRADGTLTMAAMSAGAALNQAINSFDAPSRIANAELKLAIAPRIAANPISRYR
jgi:hypothetical protein